MIVRAIYLRAEPTPRRISATWSGGCYVDLTFGPATLPSEVINLSDEDQVLVATLGVAGLSQVLSHWVEDADSPEAGWPDWYETYLANATH
jgi:hypothetical protein